MKNKNDAPKTSRPGIPADIRRQVLTESGHRCAIHTCLQTPVDIHHIDPWSETNKHRADNLIALCPNCHRRAHSGDIDRKALRVYKARLRALFRIEDWDSEHAQTPKQRSQEHEKGWRSERFSEEAVDGFPYTIDLEYPVFFAKLGWREEEVNCVVQATVLHEVMSFRSFPLCEMEARFENTPELPPNSYFRGSFDVALISRRILSMRFAFTSYIGGAYSNKWFRSLNFQMEPKVQLIEPWTLFVRPYEGLRKLSEYAKAKLCELYEYDELEWNLLEGAAPDPANFKNFNVHRHGLSVDFDEHQLGGKALGSPSILTPYAEIKEYLNPSCAVFSLVSDYDSE